MQALIQQPADFIDSFDFISCDNSGKQEAGNRKQEAGSREQEAGSGEGRTDTETRGQNIPAMTLSVLAFLSTTGLCPASVVNKR